MWVPSPIQRSVSHGPGLTGTFAAAASASRVLALDTGQVVDALGHAGQQAASLMFTHHGGMGKRPLAGQAARAGTFAALLAANGFTNAPNVFEAEYGGFPAAHTGNRGPDAYDPAQLSAGLGWAPIFTHVVSTSSSGPAACPVTRRSRRSAVASRGAWDAVRVRNHALVLEGRELLLDVLATSAPAPDHMLGSMARSSTATGSRCR